MDNSLNLQFDGGPHAEDIESRLFDMLLSYLPSESKISAEQAAEEISDLCPESAPENSETDPLAAFVTIFWSMMFRTVGQIDYDKTPMHRFILLIKTLRDLPSQRVLQAQYGSNYQQKVWQDLPWMGSELQDCWRRK
jgi:hypothetical protein